MKNINDNEVNNISEFNLLHDILNPYKSTKITDSYYLPILHGFMNTHRGRSGYTSIEFYYIVGVVTQL